MDDTSLNRINYLQGNNSISYGRRGRSLGALNNIQGQYETQQKSFKQNFNIAHFYIRTHFFICQAEFVLIYMVFC